MTSSLPPAPSSPSAPWLRERSSPLNGRPPRGAWSGRDSTPPARCRPWHGPGDLLTIRSFLTWPGSRRRISSARAHRSPAMTWRRARGFLAAWQGCQKAADRVFRPVQQDSSGRLASAWMSIVTRIQASAQVRTAVPGLQACASRYGWPANPFGYPPSRPMRSFGDFANWVVGHLDGAELRGASPAEMSRLNRKWARIFVTCARPIVMLQERLQVAARRSFLRQHGPQVMAMLTQAVRIISRAERRYGVPPGATPG